MTDENRILAESILWVWCRNTLRQLNCTYIGVQLGNRKKVGDSKLRKKCKNRSKGLYLSSGLFLSVCCISEQLPGCFLDGRLGGNNSYIIFKSTVVYPLFATSTQLCIMSVIDGRVPQQTEDRKKRLSSPESESPIGHVCFLHLDLLLNHSSDHLRTP